MHAMFDKSQPAGKFGGCREADIPGLWQRIEGTLQVTRLTGECLARIRLDEQEVSRFAGMGFARNMTSFWLTNGDDTSALIPRSIGRNQRPDGPPIMM